MTIYEIRKAFKAQKENYFKMMGAVIDEVDAANMAYYFDEMMNTINELWANGFCKRFSNDILRMANGFTCWNDTTFHVAQTYDLHCITADDRNTVKAFAEFMLHS